MGCPKALLILLALQVTSMCQEMYSSLGISALRHKRISQDPLSNVHSIVYNLIWKMQTYPDLVIVCGVKEVFEELQIVLLLKDKTLLLFYVEP